MTGSVGAVTSVAFSPDGHTLASGSLDGITRLWNLPQTILTGGGNVVSLVFSPGGDTLAGGSLDGTVRLWTVTDPARPRALGQP